MAKRMFDNNAFSSTYMRGLQGPYKLLWIYLKMNCDHAGIWNVELDIASVRCGFNYDEEGVCKALASGIVPVDGGAKWFIPEFVLEQYGADLNPTNKVHESVIRILTNFNVIDKIKPLTRGLEGAKEIEIDKEKDKDKETENEKGGVGEKTIEGELSLAEIKAKYGNINPNSFVQRGDWLTLYTQTRICYDTLEVLVARIPQLIARQADGGIQHIRLDLIRRWGEVFNTIQKEKGITKRPLIDWCTHFNNWLNQRDISTEPEKHFEHATKHNNGNRNGYHGAAGSRATPTGVIIPDGHKDFGEL